MITLEKCKENESKVRDVRTQKKKLLNQGSLNETTYSVSNFRNNFQIPVTTVRNVRPSVCSPVPLALGMLSGLTDSSASPSGHLITLLA